MTPPCITSHRRSRRRALPATPIIAGRFGWPRRATRIARSVTRTLRRAGVPRILYATSAALKAIIPNSPCCDRDAAMRERFSSTITSICSRISSGQMATACRWFAPTVTVRQRTPAMALGLMAIQKARREPLQDTPPRLVRKNELSQMSAWRLREPTWPRQPTHEPALRATGYNSTGASRTRRLTTSRK